METKKELQERYEELFGKKPFAGWSEEDLKTKITNKEKEDEGDEFNIDPKKEYHFRLRKESPRKILPREAKVWCEKTQTTRIIRLSSTEDSPYKDEQDPDSLLDRNPIVITDGNLYISGVNSNRVKFLLAFDGNASKETILPINEHLRGMYELVNKEKEDNSKLSAEDVELKARLLVKDADLEDLKDYLRSVHLMAVDSMTSTEIRLAGNEKAKDYKNALDILKNFNNPLHKIKAKVQKLFNKAELDDSQGVVKWSNGAIILNLKKDERADDALAKWVLEGSKEAKDFIKVADTKLKDE